jgi:hypothetical protein
MLHYLILSTRSDYRNRKKRFLSQKLIDLNFVILNHQGLYLKIFHIYKLFKEAYPLIFLVASYLFIYFL